MMMTEVVMTEVVMALTYVVDSGRVQYILEDISESVRMTEVDRDEKVVVVPD